MRYQGHTKILNSCTAGTEVGRPDSKDAQILFSDGTLDNRRNGGKILAMSESSRNEQTPISEFYQGSDFWLTVNLFLFTAHRC